MPRDIAHLLSQLKSDKSCSFLDGDGGESFKSVLTTTDAKMIVDMLNKERDTQFKQELKLYKQNSLCFMPPEPNSTHKIYGEKFYGDMFVSMAQANVYNSDSTRRKMWAYIFLFEKDSSIEGKSPKEKMELIDDTINKWVKRCGRLEDLNAFINSKTYENI